MKKKLLLPACLLALLCPALMRLLNAKVEPLPTEADEASPAMVETLVQQSAVWVESPLTLMSYNLENMFDPDDDPLTDDDDFTPKGSMRWTYTRMFKKLQRLSTVVASCNKNQAPAVVACVEVENDSVLYYWTQRSPLRQLGYSYVMTHSADARGINVALLYQPSQFRLLGWKCHRPTLPDPKKHTRDVLHVWGEVLTGDTLDVMVMHCPSRRGGTKKSEPMRKAVHSLLRHVADSIMGVRKCPYLVMMGDVNDYPDTQSLVQNMRLKSPLTQDFKRRELYNLMYPLQRNLKKDLNRVGSHKFDGEWGFLDQFWVSGTLMKWQGQQPGLKVERADVFAPDFLLVDDKKYYGKKPNRTYNGTHFEGGYSDHLPIVLQLKMRFKPDN